MQNYNKKLCADVYTFFEVTYVSVKMWFCYSGNKITILQMHYMYGFRYAWMPFGQGPHNCIGMRFAMLEAKLAMARILKSYVLKPSPKTQEPIRCDPVYAVSYIKGGLHIRIEKRD